MAQTKRVRCVESGRVFKSLVAAGKSVGFMASRKNVGSHIGQAAAGKEDTAGGYHWEFLDPVQPKLSLVKPSGDYSPPVITAKDPVYSSGRSRLGCDHLRRWVVLSKQDESGLVQCCVDKKWRPAMLIQPAHIKPFRECSESDRYHRDSSLPMSMEMHKLYDFHKFTITTDGRIKVTDPTFWSELTQLDGQKILGWRQENARFCREAA